MVQMADMHLGRGSLCTAHLKSMLWAVGGRDSRTFHNSTECFHPALNTWTMGPCTNTKRFAAAGGALGGAIYITGGFDGSTYTATAERLDPREKRWSPVSCACLNRQLLFVTSLILLSVKSEVVWCWCCLSRIAGVPRVCLACNWLSMVWIVMQVSEWVHIHCPSQQHESVISSLDCKS